MTSKITNIAEADHLVRYVKPRALRPDGDGNIIGCLGEAFALRESDEGSLSAAWLEFYPGARIDQIASAIRVFRTAITVKKTSGFVVGNVGAIKSACAEHRVKVRIVRHPEPGHEAHSEVRQFQDQDVALLDRLAQEEWSELVLNSSIP